MYFNTAIGAQKIKVVWAICVRDNDAREKLCNTGIVVNGAQIPLHLNNPLSVRRVEGEPVVIKDVHLWESDTLLGDFLDHLLMWENFQNSLGLPLETNS